MNKILFVLFFAFSTLSFAQIKGTIKDKEGNETACVIIGEIKTIHIDDSILSENNRINLDIYKPIARLAGSNYSTLGEMFSIKRQ